MPENEIPLPICRGVWALFEKGGQVTFDKLIEATGRPAAATRPYLDVLMRHGYVGLIGVRAAISGETISIFELLRRTGREAPYVNGAGKFIDPNVVTERPKYERAKWPTMKGRLRTAAANSGDMFSRGTMVDALGITGANRREFNHAWAALRYVGEIQRHGEDEYSYNEKPWLPCIQGYFRASGAFITADDLRRVCGQLIRPQQIEMALDMLAAEGYRCERTTRDSQGMFVNVYRAYPPASGGQDARPTETMNRPEASNG